MDLRWCVSDDDDGLDVFDGQMISDKVCRNDVEV